MNVKYNYAIWWSRYRHRIHYLSDWHVYNDSYLQSYHFQDWSKSVDKCAKWCRKRMQSYLVYIQLQLVHRTCECSTYNPESSILDIFSGHTQNAASTTRQKQSSSLNRTPLSSRYHPDIDNTSNVSSSAADFMRNNGRFIRQFNR